MITTPRASASDLLDWYDRHARDLPWRVAPADRARGVVTDPYRVWLSEIMLQQTTVATVKAYFAKFTRLWPTVGALAAAPREDVLAEWAGLGYYARARNLHACAEAVVRDHDGIFPNDEKALRELPGVGPYTAAAIAAIAFDRPAAVMDGNVERVMARIFAVETELPDAKPELRELTAQMTPETRPGDYAQAVMDLGATICTPTSPACGICPWREPCAARAKGIADQLPRKKPKKTKPVRMGHAWVAMDGEGHVLTTTRPDKGLLGGMLAVPTSEWSDDPDPVPPFPADWREVGEVRHTFTHFHLRLVVHLATLDRLPGPSRALPQAAAAMPTVFAKVLKLVTPAP
ncbi:MAG: A/G-specific adenine glycosylase [Pseudomonadota bacterium]